MSRPDRHGPGMSATSSPNATRRTRRLRLLASVAPGVLMAVLAAEVWQSPGLLAFGVIVAAVAALLNRLGQTRPTALEAPREEPPASIHSHVEVPR